jgi:drug/metabolite transporter (DMT)-like permease
VAPTHLTTAKPWQVWGALAAVYLVWGSTYLAIREAVKTLPPFLMASVRFLIAGAVLYAWAARRGDREGDRPGRAQWLAATVVGGLLLLGGNGAVVWAERRIPSGVAALLVAMVPLWMAILDRIFYRRSIPLIGVIGLVLGLAGLVLLVGSPGGHLDVAGCLVVVFGALCWSVGSLYSRTAPLPSRPLVSTALQMIAGGLLLGIFGLITGEAARFHPANVSLASIVGMVYLIVFGSWVGFSAYVWLLRNAPTSLVATYAYVNPVVAVFLGWLLVDEVVTGRTIAAAAVIVLGVALIITSRRTPHGDPADAAPDAECMERGERV